ncbi:STAS domain-containing protein [Nonomuraea sp. LPB2021202275-12-8]|uniref:STAS domain-containing protein n=1 Tax=Nonomuraea sp. LPB2021202275-12-8 TaxID=3120159 RepID=UPI00300D8AC8
MRDRVDIPAEQLLYVDSILRVTCTAMPVSSMIRIVGEVDACNSGELLRALTQARQVDDSLIIDVGGLSFVDVTGLRVLAAVAEAGGAVICNTPPQMSRLMGLLRMPAFD